jgi:UDP:flavonoid glycosyltransferase YjiC (YdhE family)
MKALFTTFPAYGHLLPMLPLAHAAATGGDEVVVVASDDLHAAVDGLSTRTLGPSLPDLLAENNRRSGEDVMRYRSDSSDLITATVNLFTTTRADMSFEALCDIATDERPDVIVAEMWDYTAPLVARRLGIPWATFVHSPATTIDAVLHDGLLKALDQRELSLPAKVASVQLWPQWLESEQPAAQDETSLDIGAAAYDTSAQTDIPPFSGERPVVLVTFGTVVDDLALVNTAVRAVLDSGADALVTTGFAAGPQDIEGDPERIRAVKFAPIGQLLDRAQAVLAAGGSGTTLAALSRGLPLAFVPRIANQPLVAAAVADFGAGVVCDDPDKLTAVVDNLLHAPALRERAEAASELLGKRPTPEQTWSQLRDRLNAS